MYNGPKSEGGFGFPKRKHKEKSASMPQQAVQAPQAPAPGPAEELPQDPIAGRRWTPRHTYGAIDLGTNNCRLLVARPTGDGFTVIDAFSRVVRLGEGMATSGKIGEDAMDRAVAALAICSEKLRRRRVSLARSVATEACRRAVNGRHFVERVRRETGICLEIIAPEEEARLAMLGCHRLLEPGDGPALIFDIGGGSTELVLIDTDQGEPRIKCWWSAPWGVVSLTESEGRDFATTEERLAAYGRMRERVRHAFRHFTALLPANKDDIRLMGTSGTVTTLASVYLALPSYDRRAVDGLKMPAAAMRQVSATLSGMDHAGRATFPCIGHERADLVVAGCAILEAIMDIWPAETLGVADRGIREGILRSLMARDGHKL
jgi:exopolyphosphatase/guanosine-5'-triphosphate,3'-diphosphate pyrophosphatase